MEKFKIGDIHVRSWGDGSKTALLIHGLASSSLTWRRLAKDLNLAGYRVIAPDLRGHGSSARSIQYSLEAWSDDIISLGIKPDLILGHSLGGLIAANIQQRLQAAKLVLVDPVYNLPKAKLMLKGIQHGFQKAMTRKLKYGLPAGNKLWSLDDVRAELISIKKWDITSVKALQAFKTPIIKCLMGNQDVLLMRAKGSFILPTYVMKRKFHSNIHLQYFKESGHNIHCDVYESFWDTLKTFLEKKDTIVYGREALSSTPTM